MLKYYIKTTEALKDFRKDQAGVVSFEYVIVAACIVAAVVAVFSTGSGNTIKSVLQDAINGISSAVAAAT